MRLTFLDSELLDGGRILYDDEDLPSILYDAELLERKADMGFSPTPGDKVDRTLAEYRYLEHGAFYAILTLLVIMYASHRPRPRGADRLGGATIIGVALGSSIRFSRDLAAES